MPALGAEITIGERTYRVHPNCKKERDQFELFLHSQALAIIDNLASAKVITREERELRRTAAFHDFAAQRFASGSQAFVDASYTEAGVKQHLTLRIGLAHPSDQPHPDKIADWVDGAGLSAALATMNAADANVPKSVSPAATLNSGESSSAIST